MRPRESLGRPDARLQLVSQQCMSWSTSICGNALCVGGAYRSENSDLPVTKLRLPLEVDFVIFAPRRREGEC
jgi:hypothetical protein